MADPFRLRVLKAITTQIKNLTPANGYTHDLSDFVDPAGLTVERVFRGRDFFGPADPLPMISILEDPKPSVQSYAVAQNGLRKGDWQLFIQGFVPDDHDNPTDPAHILVAELIQELLKANTDRRNLLGQGSQVNSVTAIQLGVPIVQPSSDGISDVAFFLLPVTLTVVEDMTKQFA